MITADSNKLEADEAFARLRPLQDILQVASYSTTQVVTSVVSASEIKVRKTILCAGRHRLENERAALLFLNESKPEVQSKVPRLISHKQILIEKKLLLKDGKLHCSPQTLHPDDFQFLYFDLGDKLQPRTYESLEVRRLTGCPLASVWDHLCYQQRAEIVADVKSFLYACRNKGMRKTQSSDARGCGPCWNNHSWKEPLPVKGFLANLLLRYTKDPDVCKWAREKFEMLDFDKTGEAGNTTVLVHLDLDPHNVLVDERYKFQGLVDWERACFLPTYAEPLKLLENSPHDFSAWLRESLLEDFPEDIRETLKEVGRLFNALREFSSLAYEAQDRVAFRKSGWNRVVSLISPDCVPLPFGSDVPAMDYEKLDRDWGPGKGHRDWNEETAES